MTEPHVFVLASEHRWEDMSPGVRRQVLGHGDDLMIVHVHFEAGAVGALHHHPHRQGTYVSGGRFVVSIGDEERELGAGDAFYVKTGVPHAVRALAAGSLVDVFTPIREDFISAT